MFGYHRQKRENKRYQRDIKELRQQLSNAQKTQPTAFQEMAGEEEQVNNLSQKQKERDRLAREEGRIAANEILSREYPGLAPANRQALQETANSQIDRDVQNYQQKLSGQQGSRGMRGGAAYGQRQDLARLGLDAQQQMQRDLTNLSEGLKLKQAAAAYNIEQGAVSDAQMRNQMARDSLNNFEQKKYLKRLSEQANKLFQRV